MNLNELRDRAYQNAVAHGWHEKELSNEHWLCLVISELMEAVEADKRGARANVIAYKDMERQVDNVKMPEKEFYNYLYEKTIKGSVEEELADVCIRLLDLAGLRDIDVKNENVYVPKEITFTEFCYKLTAVLSNPPKYASNWLKELIGIVLGWILSWCWNNRIDIHWHIEQKMKYNETIPYKHDKEY